MQRYADRIITCYWFRDRFPNAPQRLEVPYATPEERDLIGYPAGAYLTFTRGRWYDGELIFSALPSELHVLHEMAHVGAVGIAGDLSHSQLFRLVMLSLVWRFVGGVACCKLLTEYRRVGLWQPRPLRNCWPQG